MSSLTLQPLSKPIHTEVTVPGSLSYTIRALALAALTKGSVKIVNALKSDDTHTMVTILQTLGIRVEEGNDFFIVHGHISDVTDKNYELNVKISGRTARTVTALLCLMPGEKILICDKGFTKRPIKDLVDGLQQLGANITYLQEEGFLPIKISSKTLHPGKVIIQGNVSSQYVSALLMIAPMVGDLTIEVRGEQASKPFIDITIDTMKQFGVRVINENYQGYTIKSNQSYKMDTFFVESDATAASYFWAIAAITKSTIKILNMNPQSKQGDSKFVDVLEQMGCVIEKNNKQQWISVKGEEKLQGIAIDMNHLPDVVPTLAVVAAFAQGVTNISGLSHLKIKESDRIEAPRNELEKMGIEAKTTRDSLTISGGKAYGARIETYGDHRIAMAFAVAGTKVAGIQINNPEVVNKSFPNFWKTLENIGVNIR